MTPSLLERVTGCLKGIATGDAVGKQTEMLTRADVLRWYPQGVRGFEGTLGTIIPRYHGNAKREWHIGETTDDTERTIAVARAIIANRRVSHVDIGREMLHCRKCVHPGLASLWEFHQAGDPARIAERHDGCGAAIRVSPVAILYPSNQLEALVAGAWEASVPTHGGSLAIAAAAATAAAMSAAIDGRPRQSVFRLAEEAAALAERRWPDAAQRSIAGALRAVRDRLAALPELSPEEVAQCCFPNDPLTIVPLALTLPLVMDNAAEAILLATNVGGDSDSVASIAGGVLGALYPRTISEEWYEIVELFNDHNLVQLAHELAQLRTA